MGGLAEVRPTTKPTPAQLRSEYEHGQSIQGLSARYRMGTTTVRAQILSAEGVIRPPTVQTGEADRAIYKRLVLETLAGASDHELSCADIAGQLGLGYHVVYRTLQRLIEVGLVAPCALDRREYSGPLPYRLTHAGIVNIGGSQLNAWEPPITGITAQILLALLQEPIRSWRAADLANRVPCEIKTVIRFAAAMELCRWATTRRSGTEHTEERVRLTNHGVNHVKAALRREYGDGPTLIVLANAMRPPVRPIEV